MPGLLFCLLKCDFVVKYITKGKFLFVIKSGGIFLKDLISAFSVFSNMGCLCKERKNSAMKYTLCYFPLVGTVMGIILYLICILAESMSINSYITGIVALIITAVCMGRVYYKPIFEIWGKVSFVFDAMAAAVLWAVFSSGNMRGISIACAVFTLSRVMAVLLMYENSRLDDGIFKKLTDKSRKGVTAVITVVWLMGTVAFIEMQSIVCFFIIFFTGVLFYILFYFGVKKKGHFGDVHINFFVMLFETIVFAEIIALVYKGVLQ